LGDAVDERPDQQFLGSHTDMWRTKSINRPMTVFLMRNQTADANNGVVDMLGKLVAHSDTDIVVAVAVMAIGPGESFEVRNRFDVPNNNACDHGLVLLPAPVSKSTLSIG
jgi:hypothetical protein